MKIRITFDLDDETRRAIADRVGDNKPASYNECVTTICSIVEETLIDYVYEYNPDRDKEEVG